MTIIKHTFVDPLAVPGDAALDGAVLGPRLQHKLGQVVVGRHYSSLIGQQRCKKSFDWSLRMFGVF